MKSRHLAIILSFAALAGAWLLARPAEAVTSPVPCPGNVCTGTVVVGGQNVDYWYTQNLKDSSTSFKIRFRSGPYHADGNPVRFKVSVPSQPFNAYSSLKNPGAAFSLPPAQTVDPAGKWIERTAGSASAGTVYDFVQELRFDAPIPGSFAVNVDLAQYGSAQSLAPLTIYLDANSPSNRNESEALPVPPFAAGYLQCYDAVDNDLDYRQDCADLDCAGGTIRNSPLAVCEQPEAACNDGLDNDGNGLTDCADPNCNGRQGNVGAPAKYCGAENGGTNHANCADGFDNDGNGKTDCYDDTPGTGCWRTGFKDCARAENVPSASDVAAGKTANDMCMDDIDNDRNKDYSDDIDTDPMTGVDCRDYACKGLGHCPTNERLRWDSGSGSFVDTPSQCFDGLDNDLDGKTDCSDPDCLGAVWNDGVTLHRCASAEAYLPPSPLGDGVTLPAFYFNYCNDGIDNDGNGLTDGQDPTCKQRFGECGPWPATEDFTFLSCSDSKDNDLNGQTDCRDLACRSGRKLGRAGCLDSTCGVPNKFDPLLTDAATCNLNEASDLYCGDGFDNDGNGLTDCADPGCVGKRHGPTIGSGPAPYICGTENGAAMCHDGADNDGNGKIDCFDPGCQDGIECVKRPPANPLWTTASCIQVPHMTDPAVIVTPGATQESHNDRIHVGDPYKIRFIGSGSYTSLTIVIGDAVNVANKFPFDASAANCGLSGNGAAQLQYVSTDPKVGVIFERAGATLNGFDFYLTCAASSATPIGPPPVGYTIAIVANRNGTVEFGEMTASVQVYENVPPTLPYTPQIDAEGVVAGKVSIPYGATVHFQAKPNEPAPYNSGICKCGYNLNGTYVESPDGNCLVSQTFTSDVNNFQFSAAATDGAANTGATSTPQTVNINIIPSVSGDLYLGTDVNGATIYTYRAGKDMNLQGASFVTSPGSKNFDATACRVFVCTDAIACGQVAASMTPVRVPGGNTISCVGTWTVTNLPGARYWVFVEVTDSGGNVIRSNLQAFLKCESGDLGSGACKDADFDNDGTPEGRFTPGAYASPPTPEYPGSFGAPPEKACDNCVNFYNPDQKDTNGNGIGDACEAGTVGRCQYKYCKVGGTPCATDVDCTSPDICAVVNQPMCTVNCATDNDCKPPTAPLTGVCNVNWGVCHDTDPPSAPDGGNCCFADADCSLGKCDALVRPFVETVSGQIYGGQQIGGAETPPIYNATFCLQSDGQITNFTSSGGCVLPGQTGFEIPKSSNNYLGSLGTLDVNGILNGKYGPLQTAASVPGQLAGGIYYFPNGLTVSATDFLNSSGNVKASGLVVVKGDLFINGDLAYQDLNVDDLNHLASVGWIVLKKDDGTGGNVVVDRSVRKIVGAYFAEGNFDTGQSNLQLQATGALVAKSFTFRRTFASRTAGAERVIFDSRLILNPPPGMADVSRSLPSIQTSSGQ